MCDRASLEILLAKTLENFRKVDILVNCAGKIERAPTIDFPQESWRDILETRDAQRVSDIWQAYAGAGYGRIINVASLNVQIAYQAE